MNKNKLLNIAAGLAGLTIVALMTLTGWYAGAILSVVLCVTVRAVLGRSKDGGIIGVDHADRPSSSTYGGGFTPGGIFGMGNTGTRFGVYGAPTAPVKGPRREYMPESSGRKMSKNSIAIISISVALLFTTSLINWHAGTLIISALLACWLIARYIYRRYGQNSAAVHKRNTEETRLNT